MASVGGVHGARVEGKRVWLVMASVPGLFPWLLSRNEWHCRLVPQI